MPTEHQITDPLTGEIVTYVNPWTYDQGRGAWVADDVNYVSGDNFNNLLRFGQPFDPNNHFTGQFFRHDIAGTVPESGPTVIFQQENVITHGFGNNISFDDFDLVRDLRSGAYSSQLQEGQTYTLSDLQALGISPPVIGSNGQDYGDHALSTNLYGSGTPYPGADRPAEMAYIFGSVRFGISADTTFRMENGELIIDGRVELFDDNFNHDSSSLPEWLSAIVQIGAGDYVNFDQVVILYEGQGASRTIKQIIPQNDFCFLGDTSISMWPLDPSIKPHADGTYDAELVLSKVWKKPISEIRVNDVVVSFDDKGRIAPSPVTRTMQNNATHILDFWNTGVTPGHAYLCGDGKFKGQHVPLMDILRTDGAIVRDDGTLLRAATNYEVGSLGDRMIYATASVENSDGTWTEQKRGQVRFGTRIILPDGRHMSFMEMAQSKGWGVSEDGAMTAKVKTENGIEEHKFFFPYTYGEELPKPEDYILSRSEVSLQEIYAAGEWEQIGTRMPAPVDMVGLNSNHTSTLLQPSKPEPNIPPAFANRPDVPRRALNRKQRKAMEAKQRKAAKIGKRILVN